MKLESLQTPVDLPSHMYVSLNMIIGKTYDQSSYKCLSIECCFVSVSVLNNSQPFSTVFSIFYNIHIHSGFLDFLPILTFIKLVMNAFFRVMLEAVASTKARI
ncbi:hypothetical protein AB6A40_003777 [Gnathostoma spinigerum]|uniref:Uncharacterized protein n=1 Tax=Gnathostoma spinigerum TaxID=75299 RepID=A0ABD6EJB8_9BILA